MLRPILFALAAWLAFGVCAAFADAAPTTVSVLPFYQIAEPYILTAFGIVFSTLLGWGLTQLQTRTGLHVSKQAQDQFQQAAMNGAGRILAAQEGSIANIKIDVKSPLVAAEATKVAALIPDTLKQIGVTPEAASSVLADAIAGKIGVLQSQSSPSTVIGPVVVPSLAGASS